MRVPFALLITALMFGIVGIADAIEVVSANGFNCDQQTVSKNKTLVECAGQFQGAKGVFAATGYDIVHISYSPDNKRRYFYMSETGCLILNAANNEALATDKSGTKKQFSKFMDAMSWCYNSGKPTTEKQK